jgi:hypothetical protein
MIAINRSVIEVTDEKDRGDAPVATVDLVRGEYAYILLGDPGLGKTTVFTQEAQAIGERIIRARDFIGLEHDPEIYSGRTLYIDGLDETRAGTQDGRSVLGQICAKLAKLGVPRFRLSCREADWLGSSDKTSLARILGSNGLLRVYRLMPLRDSEVATLLRDAFSVSDPKQFVKRAEEMGLDALLQNPQTLKMLAKAVASHETWPDSRIKAYELACETLVTERNPEHNAAKRKSWPSTPTLLDAAGLICTVYLLANRSAIQFVATETDEASALLVREMKNDETLPLAQCLETNLFVAIGESEWIPAHRSVAEYLAARYLSQRIANGLPINRIASLMFGADGGVITSLRGLNAWLATCSPLARTRLIDVDPIGVLLYGDVKAFSKTEKVQLLRALKRSIEFDTARQNEDWNSFAFSALVTPDMTDEFAQILRNPSRERADQTLADVVVTALSHSPKLMGVETALLDLAKDSTRWPGMRRYALRAYLDTYSNSFQMARTLVDQITEGEIEDRNDDLLGILLQWLYPNELSPTETLRYLRPQKSGNHFGAYWRFWSLIFLKKISSEELPVVLDALASRPVLSNHRRAEVYWTLAQQILVRGLNELGDTIDDERLYRWMGITLGAHDHDYLSGDEKKSVHAWFASHPSRHFSLLRVAMSHLGEGAPLSRATRRLHEAKWPEQTALQLLAIAASEQRQSLAKDIFWRATRVLYEPSIPTDLSIEILEAWVNDNPQFQHSFDSFCCCKIDDWRIEESIRKSDARREKSERITQYVAALSESSPDRVNVQGLYYIALAYLGLLHEARGDSAKDRLSDFFCGDGVLIEKALAALDATCTRLDLPTAEQILSSHLSNQERLLARPLIVSLDRYEARFADGFLKLPEATLRAGLMASYASPTEQDIAWRKTLAIARPDWFADVWVQYVSASVNAGKTNVNGVYEVVNETVYAEVAHTAIPKILSKFPRRATVQQLYDLERLIAKLPSIVPLKEALSMVDARLALKVLDVGQRTYWLAAGLFLAPHKYEKRLRKWVEGSEVRIGHLGDFLGRHNNASGRLNTVPESSTSLLIELLAPSSRPDRPDDGRYKVTPEMQRGDLIAGWINELSANPSEAAMEALARLASLPTLSSWSNALRNAITSQTIVRRDANFRFASVADVAATLSKGKPANAPDLYAIVIDELDQVTAEIERGSLDLYKQCWNVDSNNNGVSPKPEEACRDSLCALMRERLARYGIDCPTESRHADRKRSDVWFTHDSFGVPAEVKRHMNDDLWSAIKNQLVAKYTIDPRAAGYGIYIVFWFGAVDKHKLVSPTLGIKPKNATQLSNALRQTLDDSLQSFIHIKVIDVSLQRLNAPRAT